MAGEYNASNIALAFAACKTLGLESEDIVKSLNGFSGIVGRLEKVAASGPHIYIDYAHTPDALLNVLRSLNAINKNSTTKGKLYTVFGCGGDRDQGKRSQMGAIASENSDYVIVTSDNPRSENPEAIIQDIIKGMDKDKTNAKILIESDRKKGIKLALEKAKSGDIVLVAGKGHEDYQIIGESKIHFSDREVIEGFLS